jgi:hypothetical protein
MDAQRYLEAKAVAENMSLEPWDRARRLAKLLGLDEDGERILREYLDPAEWCNACRHVFEPEN